MIKKIALALTLLLPTLASAEVLPISHPSPNSGTITPEQVAASTVTITGTGTKCFSVDDPTFVVDCNNNSASFSGSVSVVSLSQNVGLVSTGGTVSTDGTATVVTYSGNGTFKAPTGVTSVQILAVAGGGSGGEGHGGGGGAGEYYALASYAVGSGTHAITIGAGGIGPVNAGAGSTVGADGADTAFGGLTLNGGGGGGAYNLAAGRTGGSGGGGTGPVAFIAGGAATLTGGGVGFAGGSGHSTEWLGGGGGGAAGVGANASATVSGTGGAGITSSISGTPTVYAAGGTGGVYNNAGETAGATQTGAGAGGVGSDVAGGAATGYGSGGGGGGYNGGAGGNGKSGVVIVRFATTAPSVSATHFAVDSNSAQFNSSVTVSGNVSAASFTVSGLNGAGYIDLLEQAVEPAAPPAGTVRIHGETSDTRTFPEFANESGVMVVMGRDSVFIARNNSGGAITKGQVVYVNGATGNTPTVALAKSDATATILGTIGVVAETTIANNGFGHVMVTGVLEGVNTSAFTAGNGLFVSAATAGALTNVSPAHPNFQKKIGTTLTSGTGNGSMLINTAPFTGGLEVGTNVTFTTPYGIDAATGSFSGSVTASSVTVQAAKNTGAYATPGVGQNLLEIRDTTTQAAGVGGGVLFTGAYTGTSITDAGAIQAQKANATAGNYGFDMTFHTRLNGGTNAERMRIMSDGSVGIGTASPCSTCTLHVAGGASVTGNLSVGGADSTKKLTVQDTGYGEIIAAGSGANRIGIGVNTGGAGYCGGVYVGGTLGATFCNGGLRLGSTVTNPATNTLVAPKAIIETTQSPASGAACTAGEITWDASYIYVCTASGAWKRAALTGGY